MCQFDYENGVPECQLSFARGVPEDDVAEVDVTENNVSAGARGHQKVVQAKFEVAVEKSRESDSLERLPEVLDRNSPLVRVALHFVADKPPGAKHRKHGINQRRRPRQD
jgi:hypothetical protein